MSFTKACKSCSILESEAKEMILAHHELKSLVPKNKIKEIKGIELSAEVYLWVKKIAKTLKISQNAVMVGILKLELQKKE